MRFLSAALLGAAASLPLLAHASAGMADPAEAAAAVPAIAVPSVFDGYRAYRDSDNPSWQALNRAVMPMPAMRGMRHGGDRPDGSGLSHHSMHGAATP